MKQHHIVSIGGMAFARRAQEPFFENYILGLTKKKKPKIAFLATASGDHEGYVARFYATFSRLDCKPIDVPLFNRTPDLEKTLLSQDAIFVGGGNTKSMLAVWREWGIDRILRRAYQKGIVLAGTSAGAICWFEQGSTDSWEDDLHALDCLGFIKGSCCPHYSGEKDRRPSYQKMVKTRRIAPGVAIDDGAAVHFVNGKLRAVISAKEGASAYSVMRTKKGVHETELLL